MATVVSGDSGGGVAVGIVIAVVVIFGFLILAFGWPISLSSRSSGPTVNITTPAAPAAPALPKPAAPAPAR